MRGGPRVSGAIAQREREGGGGERERERERKREREERERKTWGGKRQRKRGRNTEREREGERESMRERDRERVPLASRDWSPDFALAYLRRCFLHLRSGFSIKSKLGTYDHPLDWGVLCRHQSY